MPPVLTWRATRDLPRADGTTILAFSEMPEDFPQWSNFYPLRRIGSVEPVVRTDDGTLHEPPYKVARPFTVDGRTYRVGEFTLVAHTWASFDMLRRRDWIVAVTSQEELNLLLVDANPGTQDQQAWFPNLPLMPANKSKLPPRRRAGR